MKEETSLNVWKESFLIEIRFFTRNDDLRKVAGDWTGPETGPHTSGIKLRLQNSQNSLFFLSFFCRSVLEISMRDEGMCDARVKGRQGEN